MNIIQYQLNRERPTMINRGEFFIYNGMFGNNNEFIIYRNLIEPKGKISYHFVIKQN